MAIKGERILVRCPKWLKEAIEQKAKEIDISTNDAIKIALVEFLKKV